ncbi:hypothetical protein D3C76_585590 [compost metagenome]
MRGSDGIGGVFRAQRPRARCGDDGRIVGVVDGQGETAARRGSAAIGGRHSHAQAAHIAVARRTAEAAIGRVEAQPTRQRVTVGQAGAVAEGIANIHIGKSTERYGVAEGRVFAGILREQNSGHGRCIVDRVDVDAQGIGIDGEGRAVADLEADADIAAAVAIEGRDELQLASIEVGLADDLVLNHRDPGTAVVVLQAAECWQCGDFHRCQRAVFRVAVGTEVTAAQDSRCVLQQSPAVIGRGGGNVDRDGRSGLESGRIPDDVVVEAHPVDLVIGAQVKVFYGQGL